MTTYFVSGHLDLGEADFESHYRPRLDEAIAAGDDFVVGDARGADTMAQAYLARHDVRVTGVHMFDQPRNNVGGFQCGEGISPTTSEIVHSRPRRRPISHGSGRAASVRGRREISNAVGHESVGDDLRATGQIVSSSPRDMKFVRGPFVTAG